MSFEIAPFRALRYNGSRVEGSRDISRVAAPPYDIISPEEHRGLLSRSTRNIVRLTLGDRPGETADYAARARLLDAWRKEGVFREEPRESFFVYGADYFVPGTRERASFRGLLALGSLHDFSERVVLPHEQTFPKVVDDRYRLLEATRTQIEQILLLYTDPAGEIDPILAEAAAGEAIVEAEAKPGERHTIWPIPGKAEAEKLAAFFRCQRPIIADGHHRYTTACRYWKAVGSDPERRAGARWQPMVLGNLWGKGLSILATHRLVSLAGRTAEALRILEGRLERTAEGSAADFEVETRDAKRRLSVPPAVREGRKGVARTNYALLHDVVLGEWLQPLLSEAAGGAIRYFKEGTGEREALSRGEGDLLFRMRPVDREEFQEVVEGGDVFPHKTTFFYPKLWSGLVLWALAEPEKSTRS